MAIMNTFWLKIAAVIVLIVAAIVVYNKVISSRPQKPAPPEKTVGDMWREDEKRLRAEPNVTVQPAEGNQATTVPPKPLEFRKLTEEEQVGAEQIYEMAIAQRKMGRLPGVSYGLMVNYCRDISQRYPGSEYDYKARRMLGEVPREQWERYKITEEEIKGPW
jgi:type IV secretory pathway VirB10-like protein